MPSSGQHIHVVLCNPRKLAFAGVMIPRLRIRLHPSLLRRSNDFDACECVNECLTCFRQCEEYGVCRQRWVSRDQSTSRWHLHLNGLHRVPDNIFYVKLILVIAWRCWVVGDVVLESAVLGGGSLREASILLLTSKWPTVLSSDRSDLANSINPNGNLVGQNSLNRRN